MTQEPYQVSILVPVYGVENYIERCARSIFEQTYKDLDIVFVDDCTPDKSIEILKTVLEDYPERKEQTRILRHDHNRGLAATRNTAVAAAEGKFVMHVDSDDWLEVDAVEELVKKQTETGADIVTGGILLNVAEPYSIYPCPIYQDKKEYLEYMLMGLWPHESCGRLIRRTLYTDYHISYLAGQNQCEDYRIMAMLLWYAKLEAKVVNNVYHYFMSCDSYCRSKKSWRQMKLMQSQNVVNYVSMASFFKDKDNNMYYLSCRNVINTAYVFMMSALEQHDKGWFRSMCSVVLTYPFSFIRRTLGWKASILFYLPLRRITFSWYKHLISMYSRGRQACL